MNKFQLVGIFLFLGALGLFFLRKGEEPSGPRGNHSVKFEKTLTSMSKVIENGDNVVNTFVQARVEEAFSKILPVMRIAESEGISGDLTESELKQYLKSIEEEFVTFHTDIEREISHLPEGAKEEMQETIDQASSHLLAFADELYRNMRNKKRGVLDES